MKRKRKSVAKLTRALRPVPLLAPPNQQGQSAARNGGGTRSRQPSKSMRRRRKHAETLGGGKLCDVFCGRPGQVSSSRGRQGIPDVSPCSWCVVRRVGRGVTPRRVPRTRGADSGEAAGATRGGNRARCAASAPACGCLGLLPRLPRRRLPVRHGCAHCGEVLGPESGLRRRHSECKARPGRRVNYVGFGYL